MRISSANVTKSAVSIFGTVFFLNINAVFAEVIIRKIVYWKEGLDEGGLGGALLTVLSRVFDCIKHGLLIAKLAAYGFDLYSQNKQQK